MVDLVNWRLISVEIVGSNQTVNTLTSFSVKMVDSSSGLWSIYDRFYVKLTIIMNRSSLPREYLLVKWKAMVAGSLSKDKYPTKVRM